MSEEGWTTVKKKYRTPRIPTEAEKKIVLSGGYPRMLRKSDYTLTPEEIQHLADAKYEYMPCICCSSRELSEFLERRVHQCHTCYCCIGDDPFGDNCEVWLESDTRAHLVGKGSCDDEDEYKCYDDYQFIKQR